MLVFDIIVVDITRSIYLYLRVLAHKNQPHLQLDADFKVRNYCYALAIQN
jgi:hypothetical protein